MNLFKIIKNLFNHHKINTSAELLRPEDIIKIPKRKDFNNDSLVDYYKREYNNILATMNDYNPLILEADELNYQIKMTSELLFSISIKEDVVKEKSIEDRINYLINSEKLDLYKNDINSLQNEVTARLISLNEIKKELFISKKKKLTIDNIISRLCLSLYTLYNEEVSIISNIERYKRESYYNHEPKEDEKEKEYEIIDKKIKHLKWLQQILDIDKQINIRTDINYILKDLALIEKNIEEYTYQNKDAITDESKEKEINDILQIPFDMEHKDELLKKIEDIELKYRAFYEYKEYQEYGNIVIDESDLTNIYNLKFSALSISKDGLVDIFVDKNTDKIETEYYQNIIFSMVQDIILGRNEIFNEVFSKDYTNAILLIKLILIDKDSNVLTDFGKLNLLLSLNRKDGLYNFFTNFKIKHYVSDCHVFEWDEELPLETICFVLRTCSKPIFIYNDKESNKYFFDNNYYDLYLIYRKYYKNDEDKYYLPLGINEIKEYSSPILRPNDLALINKIQNDSRGKIIYFPKSLKAITSVVRLFDDDSLNDIVLNDGLEEINTYAFFNQKLKRINLPSSITKISKDAFNYHYVKKVTININKDNYELLKYKNIKNIFATSINYDEKERIINISSIETLVIHLEDLDDDIIINLNNLEIPYSDSKNYNYINIYINTLHNYIKSALKNKRNEFQTLEQVLPENERLEIRNDLEGLLIDLDILNKKLKNYIELNKDEVLKLKKVIAEFYINKDFDKAAINNLQNTYKKELESLEIKYKLYRYYNMININEINMFYDAKYTYLTSFDVVKPFVNENTFDEELEYYKETISSKIEHYKNNISNNNDETLLEKIIKAILNLLGNAKSEDILNNFYLLNIFLALDNPKKLYNFLHSFNDTFIPRHYTDDKLITFNNSKPLSTSCLIYYYMNVTHKLEINLYNDEKYIITKDFLELFHLVYLYYFSHSKITSLKRDNLLKDINLEKYDFLYNFYCLPEGIKEINLENINNHASIDLKIMQNIQNDLFNKDVIIPSTLKVLKGDLFNHKPKGNIFLNEGIETIDIINFALTDDETITIPSSLKEIVSSSPIDLDEYYFKKIVFNNFNFENRNVLFNIFDIFLKNNTRFFRFDFELIFHYNDLDEDIIPKIYIPLDKRDFVKSSQNNEYRRSIIEDMVDNIEKEVKEKREKMSNKLKLIK